MFTKHLRLLLPIFVIGLGLCGCFGPFYTTLITRYETSKGDNLSVDYKGFKMKLSCESYEYGNRQGIDSFYFQFDIQSIDKYKTPINVDTMNVVKIESFCIYSYSNDITKCPGYSTEYFDSSEFRFYYDKIEKRISYSPTPSYGPIILTEVDDSVLVSYTIALYENTAYETKLDHREFKKILHRRYSKATPIDY